MGVVWRETDRQFQPRPWPTVAELLDIPWERWVWGRMHKYHPYSIIPSKQHHTSCISGWEPGCLLTVLTGCRGCWLSISSCLGSFCAAMCH